MKTKFWLDIVCGLWVSLKELTKMPNWLIRDKNELCVTE